MQKLIIFISGFIFSIGLGLSGMMNPQKVINFLDITGVWDPSLMMVMVGAIGINIILYPFIYKRSHSFFRHQFSLPSRQEIDKPLVFGSLLFGMGWGLAGICPGPAIANLATGRLSIFAFVLAMISGMMLFKWLRRE